MDYLRALITVIVVFHHCALAYTSLARDSIQDRFSTTFPIVDNTRSVIFDLTVSLNDTYFMSLMFFLSGLFVYSSLSRHGPIGFMSARLVRLGIPFVIGVLVVMPVAFYAGWSLHPQNAPFTGFYAQLAAIRFRGGPLWFIWMLLAFNGAAAITFRAGRPILDRAGRMAVGLKGRPLITIAVFYLVAALAYLPAVHHYGASSWSVWLTAPLAYQSSRAALYFLWFAAGVVVGAPGYRHGLLDAEGALAMHWRLLATASVAAFALYWRTTTLAAAHDLHMFLPTLWVSLFWLACNVLVSFTLLALFRSAKIKRVAAFDSLSRCAYGIYLMHFAFMAWSQREMLFVSLDPLLKFGFVFAVTLALSWLATLTLLKLPKVAQVL